MSRTRTARYHPATPSRAGEVTAMTHQSTLRTVELHDWVKELRAGRPDAAAPTLRKVISRVEALARTMFKSFSRAGRFVEVDDVVQNSLVRLLAALRQVRPESTRHFYALANTLIRRELLDVVKHFYGPRGHGSNLAATVAGEASGEYSPADASVDDAELDRLTAFHEAVERLPAEPREVFGLAYYHGWTQADIAELFEVSVRTVQRWHVEALTALQKVLRAG